MSDEVKKQHYVWEYYLKGWATKDQIWCKRGSSIFLTSTENVAQKRYFYEIEPLNQAEVTLLRGIALKGPASKHALDLNSLDTYLALANSSPHDRKFGMEWLHSQIEGKAAPVLRALRSGDASVLKIKQSKIDLCIYLGHQYTRTKKALLSISPLPATTVIPDHYKSVNFEKVHRAIAFILSSSIGSSLFEINDLQLVKNESNTELLTCDQPIYNLLAIPGKISKESSIYMPIGPTLALWAKKGPPERIETKEKAEELNAFMVQNCLEMIFASSESQLKSI